MKFYMIAFGILVMLMLTVMVAEEERTKQLCIEKLKTVDCIKR